MKKDVLALEFALRSMSFLPQLGSVLCLAILSVLPSFFVLSMRARESQCVCVREKARRRASLYSLHFKLASCIIPLLPFHRQDFTVNALSLLKAKMQREIGR